METTSIYEQKFWLKSYDPQIPAEVEVPNASVCELFDEATSKWKDKTAILFYGNKISFKDLRDKVDRLATALSDLGVKKGDVVGMLMLNSPEYIISWYAILKVGAIVTPISPVYVSQEIKYQIEDSGAQTVICQDFLWEGMEKTDIKFKNVILCSITQSLPASKKLMGKSILRGVYQRMSAPPPSIIKQEGFHQYDELIKKYPPKPPKVEFNPMEDIVTIPYTGGTTGRPKGVMLTHRNFVATNAIYGAFNYKFVDGKEVFVSYMPFYHAFGQGMAVFISVIRGWTQDILTTPDVDDIIDSAVRNGATVFSAAPTLFEMLKDHPKLDLIKWKNFKDIVTGADATHESTIKAWKERTGTNLSDSYGMTETTGVITWTIYNKGKLGASGIPVCNTTVAILDPEKDEFVPLGELGEVSVIGPQVMKGYWKNPQATRDTQGIVNGKTWLRTGDLARMDEDGFVHLYDRKRDLIKYKGLRVYAREVEEVIKGHPQVKEVGIVAVPDQLVGENVKAFVVLESDARGKVTETDIANYCQDKLAHYKIPKIIEFVGEIPKTDVGKVSRRELREMET